MPGVGSSPAPVRLVPPGSDPPEEDGLAIPEPSAPAASPVPESFPTGASPPVTVPTSPPETIPTSPPVTVPLAAPAGQLARLAIDFEHPLKSGTLRVWLGATLILNEELDSRVTKKFIALKLRKGGFQEVLAVSPGRHVVTVEVKWDDTRRSERISGNLKAGSAQHLKIRLSRLKKDLSVDWE